MRSAQATPRLDLFGEVVSAAESPGDEAEPATLLLVSVSAIRVRNALHQDVAHLDVDEIVLEEPLVLDGSLGAGDTEPPPLFVVDLPGGRVVLEGLESPVERFLDLVALGGWKLELWLEDGGVHYGWYHIADWGIDTSPDYYPGSTLGEVEITGPTAEGGTAFTLPWPFSAAGRLELREPVREEEHWSGAVPLPTFGRLFDAVGPALRDFPLSRLTGGALSGALSFRSRIGADGWPACELRLDLSGAERTELLELSGQQLVLTGAAALVISVALGPTHTELLARLAIAKGAGFHLEGPPIVTLGEGREMLALVPGSDAIRPKIDLALTARADEAVEVARVRIPARWDATPSVDPVGMTKERLAGFDVVIDGRGLTGFRLGSIEGSSPRVELQVVSSRSDQVGDSARLVLDVVLSVQAFDPLRATWAFTLDRESRPAGGGQSVEWTSLALRPAGTLEFSPPGGSFKAWGLTVEGLGSATATWQDGQLVVSASNLRAFCRAISSGDPSSGFELEVPRLRIGPGGVDAEMTLVGGAPKLDGIGEAFKGVEGAISFVASRLQKGYIRAQGPLPWLDNATGSVTLVFREGLALDQVKAEFQLGLHRRVAWWFELDLKALRIDVDLSRGDPTLLMRVTGAVEFRPPADAGDTVARYLGGVRLELNDLLLTRAFADIPAAITPVVELHKPEKVPLFGAFELEMRSLGIVPAATPGEAAVKIGGQIFFSSADLLGLDVELHDLKLEAPAPGSLLPRVSAERLRVRFAKGPVEVDGYVRLVELPERKGFEGGVRISIEDLFGADVWCEMARVVRPSDGRELRVWAVCGQILDLNVPLLAPIYLRDVDLGFGWRKTLAALDDPDLLVQPRGAMGRTAAPHLRSSWLDDLEGDDACWTVALAAWVSLGAGDRDKSTPLAGDLLLSIRSDLTLLAAMRGWFMQPLDALKSGETGARPAVLGRLLVNPRRRHLLAEYTVDPTAAVPRQVPDFIARGFLGNPFPFAFETRQDFFRLEVAWPRHLKIPMGAWDGRAGFLVRIDPSALTVGLGFELYRSFEASHDVELFGGRLFIDVFAYLGFWGELVMRLGAGAALFGRVGVTAILRIEYGFELNIKIGWFRIYLSLSFGIEIILSARLELGISGAGVGFIGVASVSARIWKFSFSGSVQLEVNAPAVDAARNAVLGATAGVRDVLPPSVMPDGDGELPVLSPPAPTWAVLSAERDGYVWVLLLPKKDSWFAGPVPGDERGGEEAPWAGSAGPDYVLSFTARGAELDGYLCGGEGTRARPDGVEGFVAWNHKTASGRVGDLFYEPDWKHDQIRLIEAILDDPRYRPELLVDWRVRAEGSRAHEDRAAEGLPPGVRSPHFTAEDSFYDLVLEEACSPNESLSWQAIAVGMTEWEDTIKARDEGEFVKRLLAEADLAGLPEQEIDHQLLLAAERWHKERSGLAIRLLDDFRAWIGSAPSEPPPALLAQAGVALRFRRTSEIWSIQLDALRVRRRAAGVEEVSLEGAHIASGARGLGFAAHDRTYRVRDVREFQGDDGIHFSWLLECVDENGVARTMTHEEMAGLAEPEGLFQFFDRYEVVRLNLSRDDPSAVAAPVEVRPGFIPALIELGDEDPRKTFFLLAPRFDFSDRLDGAASPGEPLLYRITAIDTFGQRSQTTEYVTTRKRLRPPEAPKGCEATYEVRLAAGGEADERLDLVLRPAEAGAPGEPVHHEVWMRSYPIGAGGYFGFGDDVDDDPAVAVERSAVEPQGMTRLATIPDRIVTLGAGELGALGYGRLHELFVRAVAASGGASRLVRCEVTARIHGPRGGEPERRPQAFLERIPPPAAGRVAAWVPAEDMRVEVQRAQIPRPGAAAGPTRVERRDAENPAEREVTLRFLHERALDDAGSHPTGGYEILVRDRDASFADDLAAYQRLAEVEVVPLARYRSSPRDTANGSAWHGSYLREGDRSAFRPANAWGDGEDLAYLDWGPALGPGASAAPSTRILTMPDAGIVHFQLEVLLFELQELCAAEGVTMIVRSAPPSREQTAARSFASLLEEHTEDKDPNGARLLAILGRSADVHLGRAGEPLAADEVLARVRQIVEPAEHGEGFAPYLVLVEILLHADRRTPMSFFRLSLQPRLRAFQTGQDAKALRQGELERFLCQLAGFGIGTAVAQESPPQGGYERLVRRFLRQQRVAEDDERVRVGVAFYEAGGSQDRPLNDDDTVSVPLYYRESYARRFAYRVRRLSRYVPLYRELGLFSPQDLPPPGDATTLLARLPRVKPPAPPVVLFLGSFAREGAPPTAEWIVEEHEEEAMVQSNETLRNRLGFRGLAWTLHAQANADWLQWSGWNGEGPALTDLERLTLEADAAWPDSERPLPATAGLEEHPFVGLLQPKGTVVRVPRLPYYYRYRLAAFARTDDVDSEIRVVDAAQVFPAKVPAVDPATAGWCLLRRATAAAPARLELWWRVPPVWQSLEAEDRALWPNEEPFASRLWDFDLSFEVKISRNQVCYLLLTVRLDRVKSGKHAAYGVQTGASWLYEAEKKRIETLQPSSFPSPFEPEIRIAANAIEELAVLIDGPEPLELDLWVSRPYGRGQPQRCALARREPGGAGGTR